MQMTVRLLIITPPSPRHSLFFNFFKSKQPALHLRLRIPSPFFFITPSSLFKKRTMVTSTSLSNTNVSDSFSSSYTTITETVTFEREIKKSKFIAIAGSITDEQSALSFLSQVKDSKATHNCWAYKVGDQYRSNDDGEPSGTAGKPIYTAIASSGIDRVMVVVIRYFGGIKLGTGGLVRAYGGVASECLKNATTCLVKSKISIAMEVPYDLLGVIYHQIQSFQVEDIMQEYDTDKEGITIVSFKVDYDRVKSLEDAIKANCSRQIVFVKLENRLDPLIQ